MLLDNIVFIFYLVLLSWLITRIPFFKKSGIGVGLLVALFCIKVAAGVLYGLYYNMPSQKLGADTWRFYRESVIETDDLLHRPLYFISNFFQSNYQQTGGFFSGDHSYWNDLKDNILIKILAINNVFTGKNYYADGILLNFLQLFGLVAFYKTLQYYCRTNTIVLAIAIFLMPSFLFWSSGIHKDGLLCASIGLVFYTMEAFIQHKAKAKHYLIFGLAFIFIFFTKSFVALAAIPALVGWWISANNHKRSHYYFILVYASGMILLMSISLLGSHYNMLTYIANKQHEFMALKGNSAIDVMPLQPTTDNFIKYLPTALDIAFLRPHITELKNPAYLMSFLELVLCAIIICLFAWFATEKKKAAPFLVCCFYFALSILLIEGYTVTFTGATVRYRSLMLPFIISPMVAMIPLFNRKRQRINVEKEG